VSWRRVTVKNTKEQNPWIYCQRMINTNEREGWRTRGRHCCFENGVAGDDERVGQTERKGTSQ